MTNKEWAIERIKIDEQNIAELKEERSAAWKNGDRRAYDSLTRDIRDLNVDIRALRDAYEV